MTIDKVYVKRLCAIQHALGMRLRSPNDEIDLLFELGYKQERKKNQARSSNVKK